MKRVMVSELKAHLSEFLAAARGGETIVVCDRRTPIALLTPIEDELDDVVVQLPTLPMSAATSLRTVKPSAGVDVLDVLEQIREDRL